MELQRRMEDARRKFSQLDDLLNQLLRTLGGAVVELSNQTGFGYAQGRPIYPSTATTIQAVRVSTTAPVQIAQHMTRLYQAPVQMRCNLH